MTRSTFGALLTAALLAPAALAQQAPVLVAAEWLNDNLDEVTVLNVSFRPGEFAAEHIPGAQVVMWSELVDNEPPGSELPQADALESLFRSVGVTNERPVVVYGGHIPAARGFMTLEYLGHQQVHVLDGGLDAWKEKGFATASGPADEAPAGDFMAAVRDDMIVDADWILANLDAPDVTLIDARPDNEYRGEGDYGQDRGLKPGHIPGANQVFYRELVRSEEDPRYLDLGALADRYREANAEEGDTLVSYCMVGMRASVAYMISRHLGYDSKFYDGSWVDWSARDLPVVEGTEPGGR